MKHFAVIVAFLILMNPLVPVLDYAVNYNYIVKELCVNRYKPKLCCRGTCYLKKELAKSVAGENNNSKKSDVKKVELPVYLMVNSCSLCIAYKTETKPVLVTTYTSGSYAYLHAVRQLKPPIQLS